MNMIIDDIKATQLQYRKDRNKEASAFLSFVIGEVQNKAMVVTEGVKTYPDKDVTAILKSIHKKISDPAYAERETEVPIIEVFLPTQLTEQELIDILTLADLSSMQERMKYLKENYIGQYDGRLAVQVAKEMVE